MRQMAFILYDQGKKVGEVSDWIVESNPPVYKDVLGKTVLATPANDGCSFVSPKPVNRKTQLKIIEAERIEYDLKIVRVQDHTRITAKILAKTNLAT